jgi:hypothetical protein
MVTPFRTLMLAAAGLLAACTVIVEEPRPVPRPGVACTFEYTPVCGRRGDRERTFSNACLARVEGFRVVHRGQCTRAPVRPSVCSREFNPVCAQRGSRRQTFTNACLARVEGFRVVSSGRCGVPVSPIACTREFDPVCGIRGNRRQTMANACEARAGGFRILHRGRCR